MAARIPDATQLLARAAGAEDRDRPFSVNTARHGISSDRGGYTAMPWAVSITARPPLRTNPRVSTSTRTGRRCPRRALTAAVLRGQPVAARRYFCVDLGRRERRPHSRIAGRGDLVRLACSPPLPI
jgi:hypothetical protein